MQRIIRQGNLHVIDVDLSKFFDRRPTLRVGARHDVLMSRVSRKVHDKRLLKLIGRYLRAGVMVEGVLQPTPEGSPQGGPLSPLLSNILLDDLDKELERRGLQFVPGTDRAPCAAGSALVGGRFSDLREKLTKCPASIRVGAAIRYPDPKAGREPDEESGNGSRGLRIPRLCIC